MISAWVTSSFSFYYSNDKNLCSKALLSGVKALSKVDLEQQAEVNPDLFHQHYDQTSAYPHPAPILQHQEGDMASYFILKTGFAQGFLLDHMMNP